MILDRDNGAKSSTRRAYTRHTFAETIQERIFLFPEIQTLKASSRPRAVSGRVFVDRAREMDSSSAEGLVTINDALSRFTLLGRLKRTFDYQAAGDEKTPQPGRLFRE